MRIEKRLRALWRYIDNNIEEWVFGQPGEKIMSVIGIVVAAGLIFMVIDIALAMR